MSSQKPKQQENKQSLGYAFKQQVMKAWQPVPTLNSTIFLFLVLSMFFLIMGIVLISLTQQVSEHYQRYDVLCLDEISCTVEIALDEDFQQPVYLYYELSNFYQNHRRYVKSKSTSQLSGSDLSLSDLSALCDPALTNGDLNKNVSVDGTPLNSSQRAIPCGLIAKSMFNDTFNLSQKVKSLAANSSINAIVNVTSKSNTKNSPNTASNNFTYNQITILNTSIAWPSDLNGRYKNVPNYQKLQWINMETDEHFMVWMRTAALPTFRKLWGRIEQTLKKGKYTYTIQNHFPVGAFDGQKALVLSTANAFGGKNTFLSIAYLVVGVVCALITIGFTIRKLLNNQESKNK